MNKGTGLNLIHDYINRYKEIRVGYDSYPVSLRNLFWIRFVSKHSIHDEQIDAFLYDTYTILSRNIEYHLLGNHVLENAFSLLFGAYYFHDQKLYHTVYRLLRDELDEQILSDGAHFELSPMYHQIILYRLLDAINLVQHNERFADQDSLLAYMRNKALSMLQWLQIITFSNGTIPLLNDAAPGIAPSTQELNQYALNLKLVTPDALEDIRHKPPTLSQSGYRCFKNDHYECIVDIGQIGPSYQSGHAHADSLNFVLNVNNKPVIVDTGISTYDPGKVRLYERGTAAHNTVTVSDCNSSEVWSSFSVARRAKVRIIEENVEHIIAEHDGYKRLDTIHRRQWDFTDKQIMITDYLIGKMVTGNAYLHIAAGYTLLRHDSSVKIENMVITFEHANNIDVIQTEIPKGYNQFQENYTIVISFTEYIKTIFQNLNT
jgi:hypothetical protein